MTVLMTPDMANFSGNVHGGTILKFLDQVAYACASRYAGRYVVTLSVDQVMFRHANSCFFTMVAVGDEGKPTPVPPLVPESADQQRRWANAVARKQLRAEMEQRQREVRQTPSAPV
jgi:acyl-CoA hydrolase